MAGRGEIAGDTGSGAKNRQQEEDAALNCRGMGTGPGARVPRFWAPKKV